MTALSAKETVKIAAGGVLNAMTAVMEDAVNVADVTVVDVMDVAAEDVIAAEVVYDQILIIL